MGLVAPRVLPWKRQQPLRPVGSLPCGPVSERSDGGRGFFSGRVGLLKARGVTHLLGIRGIGPIMAAWSFAGNGRRASGSTSGPRGSATARMMMWL